MRYKPAARHNAVARQPSVSAGWGLGTALQSICSNCPDRRMTVRRKLAAATPCNATRCAATHFVTSHAYGEIMLDITSVCESNDAGATVPAVIAQGGNEELTAAGAAG